MIFRALPERLSEAEIDEMLRAADTDGEDPLVHDDEENYDDDDDDGREQDEEETLPEAQRTQGIDSVPWIISIACFHLNFRDNSRCGVNTLGPLCL